MPRRKRTPVRIVQRARALIYVRISPRNDGSGELGAEAQRAQAEQYAKLYGLEVVGVVEDLHVSGGTLDRPGLQRALAILRKGEADTLIVAKLDRLVRSVRGLGELLEEHFGAGRASLCSVAEQLDTRSASGRLVANILASVAQWERETISERTIAALAVKRRRGERTGEVPFGYQATPSGKLEENEREQAALKFMRGLRKRGETLRGVVAELNASPHRARGECWHLTSVARILRHDEGRDDG